MFVKLLFLFTCLSEQTYLQVSWIHQEKNKFYLTQSFCCSNLFHRELNQSINIHTCQLLIFFLFKTTTTHNFLPFHPSVLVPGFHLQLTEAQRLSQVDPAGEQEVSIQNSSTQHNNILICLLKTSLQPKTMWLFAVVRNKT